MDQIEAHPIRTELFNNQDKYNQFLAENNMGSGTSSWARGKLNPDGSIIVAIYKDYYLRAGIRPEQLEAIVEHERFELTTDGPEAHRLATVAEYQWIYSRFGLKGLNQYHVRMGNLMGGLNDDRKFALEKVLSGENTI